MNTRDSRRRTGRPRAWVTSGTIASLLVLLATRQDAEGVATLEARATVVGDTVSKTTLLLGEKIFKGVAAHGICFTCHGVNAKGIPGLGPDLTDTVWLHGDGSVAFIKTLVTTGVSKPKKSPATMPPFGGSPLVEPQLEAVAQYVHSLSNK
ncbi:MAG: c-type cytochrome [Gemmatimonadaceae bacterium]